jgi:hypothetical protein
LLRRRRVAALASAAGRRRQPGGSSGAWEPAGPAAAAGPCWTMWRVQAGGSFRKSAVAGPGVLYYDCHPKTIPLVDHPQSIRCNPTVLAAALPTAPRSSRAPALFESYPCGPPGRSGRPSAPADADGFTQQLPQPVASPQHSSSTDGLAGLLDGGVERQGGGPRCSSAEAPAAGPRAPLNGSRPLQVPVKLTLSTSDITTPTDVKPLYVGPRQHAPLAPGAALRAPMHSSIT